MRKCLSYFLAFLMLFALCMPALAAESEAQEAAEMLYELGLFKGTGTDAAGKPVFDLGRAPTRAEAVTMLVRLLGKEEDARSGRWEIPFTDIANWAKPYVGYAYANGLTTGVSETRFGGSQTVTAAQFLTFTLRALGYESGKDFSWDGVDADGHARHHKRAVSCKNERQLPACRRGDGLVPCAGREWENREDAL